MTNFCFSTLFITLFFISISISNTLKTDPIYDLITRITPSLRDYFQLSYIETESYVSDYFILSSNSSKITIQGTSLPSISYGYKYYLSNYLNLSISWTGDNLSPIKLPPPFPSTIKITRKYNDTYYLNVCTFSYSFVWWDWSRWERELDFMAMRGVTLALAFTGQESVMLETLKQLGVSEENILNEYFSGPAFLAWQRMGNIRGYGGPIRKDWIDKQFELGKKIVNRMRNLGIKTVLPTFNGYVPIQMKDLYPNSKINRSGSWNRFPNQYCCENFVDPADPLYKLISKKYIQNTIKAFGTDHYYNGDQFNENDPASKEENYLKAAGKSMIDGLLEADSKAIWVMQSWLFSNSPFWNKTLIKAYIGDIPNENFLILDLYSEVKPVYNKTDAYFGKPFIWNELHNFGGRMGLYGKLPTVFNSPHEVSMLPNSKMTGVGITMEGINQNTIVYELVFDIPWLETKETLNSWTFSFLKSRYGKDDFRIRKAWSYLLESVYNNSDLQWGTTYSFIEKRPNLNFENNLYYDRKKVGKAAALLIDSINSFKDNEGFKFDLVDIIRQVLSDKFTYLYLNELIPGYKQKKIEKINRVCPKLLEIIKDLNLLCGTIDILRLDTWIESAEKWANSTLESKYYQYNAKNQLTLWGPNGENNDYASKQWNGLFSTYYLPRWDFFLKTIEESIKQGIEFDENKFNSEIFEFEKKWNEKQIFTKEKEKKENLFEIIEFLAKKYEEELL